MDTKTIQATIDYKLFNELVMLFDLNNQDELDACIETILTERVEEQMTLDAMREAS